MIRGRGLWVINLVKMKKKSLKTMKKKKKEMLDNLKEEKKNIPKKHDNLYDNQTNQLSHMC